MDGFIKEFTRQIAEKIDDQIYEFLEKNGYHLERGNIQQIEQLRDELASKDIQIRCETFTFSYPFDENYNYKAHTVIFFDSISTPRDTQQVRNLILEDFYKGGGVM